MEVCYGDEAKMAGKAAMAGEAARNSYGRRRLARELARELRTSEIELRSAASLFRYGVFFRTGESLLVVRHSNPQTAL